MKIILHGYEVWDKTMDVEELTQNLAKYYDYEKCSYDYDITTCSYEINLTDRSPSKNAQDKTETEKNTEIKQKTEKYYGEYTNYYNAEKEYITALKEILPIPMEAEIIIMQNDGIMIRKLHTTSNKCLLKTVIILEEICSDVQLYKTDEYTNIMAYFRGKKDKE